MKKLIPNIFLSQSLDSLVDCFLDQISQEQVAPFGNRIVLVPNESYKQWLLSTIARKKGIAMGLKIFPIEEGILFLLQSAEIPNSLEMSLLLYDALCQNQDPDLLAYLDGKKKRILALSDHLSSLFFRYGIFGEKLFTSKTSDWQMGILHSLFIEGSWKLPIQILPTATSFYEEPIHCFAIDFLPQAYWEYLFRFAPLSLYLFSPCQEYWEDLQTDRERKKLVKKASKKIRPELDSYLQEVPSPLANWGKMGRENLKNLDPFPFQSKEAYFPVDGASLLKRVQRSLLQFEVEEKLKAMQDSSLKVILTGSSKLREVEVIRDEILKLASCEGISFHEISILIPNLEIYIPLIEFVFNEKEREVPYRILGHDVRRQSSFFQGLSRLLNLGRWESDALLSLFETLSFSRKQNLDESELEQIEDWIREVGVEWGLDQNHRKERLKDIIPNLPNDLQTGSWEHGLEQLLERLVYLRPKGIDPDSFEKFLALFQSLKEDLAPFHSESSLSVWADRLEALAEKYLSYDLEDEADSAAYSSFQHLIQALRQAGGRIGEKRFPFAPIERFLDRPTSGNIHGSHLHAVRISSLSDGAALPSKALFLLGMDEESFPEPRKASSLNLLVQEKIPVIEPSDRDRYLFLQTLFSATDFLRISYGHLSSDEGKPVGPSILVQELMSYIDGNITETAPAFSEIQSFLFPKRTLSFWPDWTCLPPLQLPEGEITLSISDLSSFAKNPWKFYLQKIEGVYLKEEWEDSFSSQKSRCLRAILEHREDAKGELPYGLIGKALEMEIDETAKEWEGELKNWGAEGPFSLPLKEMVVTWDKLKVRIVGEIRNATSLGFLHTGGGKIGDLLRDWPEILVTGIILNTPQVLLVKEGKIKLLNRLEEALKSFIEYYFRCQTISSPLISSWADPFLRKGVENLEIDLSSEDPIVNWVLARAQIPSPEVLFEQWAPMLRGTFSTLIEAFPTRSKKGEFCAEV